MKPEKGSFLARNRVVIRDRWRGVCLCTARLEARNIRNWAGGYLLGDRFRQIRHLGATVRTTGFRLVDMKSDVDDGSPIDLHRSVAVIGLAIGMLVAGIYYVFSQLGVVTSWLWRVMVIAQCFVSIVLYVHYLMNRQSRRLWVEGIVSMMALVPWLMIAFIWLFYVSYILMPAFLKVSVVLVCFAIIGWHAIMVFSDFRRAAKKDAVLNTIYHDDGNNLIMRHSCGGYIDHLTSRTPLKGALMSAVAYLIPLAAAIGSNTNHITGEIVGPHVLCIILSLLGFPMSVSIIGNFYVRNLFFRVYLPLKLERQTGKKVILRQ